MKFNVGIRKSLVYVLVGLVFFGLGIGSMVLKEKLYPSNEKVVLADNKKGPLVELEEFTVNLDGGGILRAELTVETVDEKSKKVLEEEKAFLRDKALTVLAAQKITDVSTELGREKLRNTLLMELNSISNSKIRDVLFKSYMYQPN
ncbi:flagellar basal body-associated protein FliL [Syntrophobotulus glycolicus DSM 8271]|uniref:Flagellar protein FliL n=1 Tax=Syntrophobotulus glycolicus (strain DSM 8271 / FlGlyR) TaxID=645991 RepID=F0SZF9_SYNGF|nr:flagellar basal body-associated FliL family protein [Syntrophobotulus glycolicus]ADY54964.1 flagellar basal body-associated protein FliL [Syntrophobotulus glycolicus DSM 8271]